MKLAKALKEKNRLIREISRLQGIISRDNCYNSKNVPKTDVKALMNELAVVYGQLCELKTKIAKANIGIYILIEDIAQTKAYITWINTLNTTDHIMETPAYNGTVVTTITCATIKREEVDAKVKALEAHIADLQDRVDAYNATTDID